MIPHLVRVQEVVGEEGGRRRRCLNAIMVVDFMDANPGGGADKWGAFTRVGLVTGETLFITDTYETFGSRLIKRELPNSPPREGAGHERGRPFTGRPVGART